MSVPSDAYFLHVHLLVTGETEEEHLPKLFSRLESAGVCRFAVERRIRQLSPRAKRRQLKMVGRRGDRIPSRAENEISLPARAILRGDPSRFVVLIDDLEYKRQRQIEDIFGLYREALDKLLNEDEKARASVHFLVNMLEAYFFADPAAVEQALGIELSVPDGDVENIRNPKALLKRQFPNYHERRDGGRILEHLDLYRVLSNPETCSWLRSCVAWLVRALPRALDSSLHPKLDETTSACRLAEGRRQPLTYDQGSSSL